MGVLQGAFEDVVGWICKNRYRGANTAAEARPKEETSWKTFTAPAGRFRIEMPGHVRDEAQWDAVLPGKPKVHRLLSGADGLAYSATCYEFAGEFAAREALREQQDEFSINGMKLLRMEKLPVAGLEGYQYHLKHPNGTRCIRRSMQTGSRVFHLDVSFHERAADIAIEQYTRFFRSLALIDAAPETGGTSSAVGLVARPLTSPPLTSGGLCD